MTDLPPIEYLEKSAREHDWANWASVPDYCRGRDGIIAHARALYQLAQARAELAALKPRETLEDVARREAQRIIGKCGALGGVYMPAFRGFLRGVQMQKEGVLPDE